jgi:hypothetical protein
VNCEAACVTVPYPDHSGVSDTTECINACDQGNGTAEENAAYAQCRDDCINEHYLNEGGAQSTGGDNGSSSGSDASTSPPSPVTTTFTSGSEVFTVTSTPTASATSDEADATSTSDGAGVLFKPIGGGVGFLGFLAALLL